MTNISKPSTWIFRLAVYSIVLIASYLGVAAVSDMYVRDKAHKFCHAIVEGDSASYLLAIAVRAEVMQADEQLTIRRDSANSVVVEFPGLTPFDGYACSMTTKNDIIQSKTFSELP
jgi:hypothetical protein